VTLLIRSIPLSSDTMDAWKAHDGWFPRRDRDFSYVMELYRNNHPIMDAAIVNLGRSTWNPSEEEFDAHGVGLELVFDMIAEARGTDEA
jgi:hypothetical protein